MVRWHCAEARCPEFGKGACLVLPGENGQCRTLNALQLGQWNNQIVRGNATVENYPVAKLKLPMLQGSRNTALTFTEREYRNRFSQS